VLPLTIYVIQFMKGKIIRMNPVFCATIDNVHFTVDERQAK